MNIWDYKTTNKNTYKNGNKTKQKRNTMSYRKHR